MKSGSAQPALEALGALLRAQRQSKGLSLRELATRTGISNAYLSELERGRHEPSLSVLRAIASALDTGELVGQFESEDNAKQACARNFAQRRGG